MIFGPIFRLELLTVGRRRRYIFLRTLYAIGLLFAIISAAMDTPYYMQNDQIETYARFAKYSFALFACIQLGCILLLTPAMVAGTIASEHERKTIDYLLTTQLRDSEITLGKFAARLLTLGAFLLTALPIVVMMMMFGGISPEMVFDTFTYALLTLLATASLSLWISASSRHSRTAVTSAYLTVIVLCTLPLTTILYDRRLSNTASQVLVAWNPLVLLACAFDGPPPPIAQYATPAWATIVYGSFSLVCLGAAVWSLRRTYLKTMGRGAAPQSKFAWLRPLKLRNYRLGRFPMLWKEIASQHTVLRLGWIGRLASAAIYIIAYVGLGMAVEDTFVGQRSSPYYEETYRVAFDDSTIHEFSIGAGAAVGSLALLLITSRAAGSVTAEKEQDSWLTLLSTPLEGRSIVGAKVFGAIYSVRYWYLFLGLTWLICIVREPMFSAVVPALVVVHLTLAWLCAVVGVLFSVVCKNSLRSIGFALLTVGALGAGIPLLAMGTMDLFRVGHREIESMSASIFPAMMGGCDELLTRYFSPRHGWYGHDTLYRKVLAGAVVFHLLAGCAVGLYLTAKFDKLANRIEPRRQAPRRTTATPTSLEAQR